MLSRTADHLYWMARYMERAENTARMLDVNYQTSLLQPGSDAAERGWRGLLGISELSSDYANRRGEITDREVMDYMVRDTKNPSSIANCIAAARENARAVRGTLTTEVWETQNQTWLEFNRKLAGGAFRKDPSEFFEWVKFRSHLSRGVSMGTMLQDEASHFMRLGTFLERADNTARLMDVKFHGMGKEFFGSGVNGNGTAGSQSQSQAMGRREALEAGEAAAPAPKEGEYDFYHWSAILRSMSGFEVYRKVYRNVIRPEKVVELLILRSDMPRSLAACMNEVHASLKLLANEQSDETLRRAGRLRADLQYACVDEILANGLHAFLTQFLDRINTIGLGISHDFLVPVTA